MNFIVPIKLSKTNTDNDNGNIFVMCLCSKPLIYYSCNESTRIFFYFTKTIRGYRDSIWPTGFGSLQPYSVIISNYAHTCTTSSASQLNCGFDGKEMQMCALDRNLSMQIQLKTLNKKFIIIWKYWKRKLIPCKPSSKYILWYGWRATWSK